jgi:hypothetical protein
MFPCLGPETHRTFQLSYQWLLFGLFSEWDIFVERDKLGNLATTKVQSPILGLAVDMKQEGNSRGQKAFVRHDIYTRDTGFRGSFWECATQKVS